MAAGDAPHTVTLDALAWLCDGQTAGLAFGKTSPEELGRAVGEPDSLGRTVTGYWLATYGECQFAFRPDRKLWDAKLVPSTVFMAIPGHRATWVPQDELQIGTSAIVCLGTQAMKTFHRLPTAISTALFARDKFQITAMPDERQIAFTSANGDRRLDITYALTSRPVDDGLFDIDYFLSSIRISDYALIRG